jgi:hypothetical protein
MINDSITVKGNVDITLFDKDGNVKQHEYVKNLVTTLGKNFIARKLVDSFIEGVSPDKIQKIGIGIGTTAANVADTTLANQVQINNTHNQTVDNVNTNQASYITTFLENQPAVQRTISEVGLFTNNDVMVCRTVLSSTFTKATTDYLVVNWTLQIG